MSMRSGCGLWCDRIVRSIVPLWLRPGRSRIGHTLVPVSRQFGLDRGLPIDRWYIEHFLGDHAINITGRVLEIGDRTYTTRFGGQKVERSDVLHAVPGNLEATIVGDLATGTGIPEQAYDAVILTQVLPFIFDIRNAVTNLHRCLKPGGVALITVPGISQISRYDAERWGDFWRFTEDSLRTLLADSFPAGNTTISTWGNPLVASALLYGLAAEELSEGELLHRDRDYPVILTAVVRRTSP